MQNKIISYYPLNADLAALMLRLSLGSLFVYYGYLKVESYHEVLPVFGDYIGIGSELSYHLVIFAELVCGFLVAIGFLTRLSVIPIFITMVVAFFIAHAQDPFVAK